MNVVFSKNGVTSWGYSWAWVLGGGVELKAPDGHALMNTDLHTLDPDEHFEDERYDPSFAMLPEWDAEWVAICWDCYQAECSIYDMVLKSVRLFVQDYEARPSDDEFSDMLAACLDAVRKQRGWSCEELEWLFEDNGPVNVAVDEWLAKFLGM